MVDTARMRYALQQFKFFARVPVAEGESADRPCTVAELNKALEQVAAVLKDFVQAIEYDN